MICTSVPRKNDSHETRAGDTIIETCSALTARNKLCCYCFFFIITSFFFLLGKQRN